MRLWIWGLAVFMMLVSPRGWGEGMVLQGSVSQTWSVDSAREEAFRGASPRMDLSRFPATDPYLRQHHVARLIRREHVGDRLLTYFDNGSYGVSQAGSLQGVYYNASGRLFAVDFDLGKDYPIKSYKYSYPSGRLLSVSISVSAGEDFVFTPDGQLSAHWVGDQCFDATGAQLGNRTALKK